MQLERKLKTALDELRLLILGAQVLFGFQFQSVFQEGFRHLGATAKSVQGAGLLLMLLTIGLLISPSLYHQIVHDGESRLDALNVATWFAGASLLPLTLGLAASAFVVFGHVFGGDAGIIAGSVFGLVALSLLYGLGFVMRLERRGVQMPTEPEKTPLATKIEQMLTEARVIIPGGQALLGFQLVVTLSQSFSDLPATAKYIHAGRPVRRGAGRDAVDDAGSAPPHRLWRRRRPRLLPHRLRSGHRRGVSTGAWHRRRHLRGVSPDQRSGGHRAGRGHLFAARSARPVVRVSCLAPHVRARGRMSPPCTACTRLTSIARPFLSPLAPPRRGFFFPMGPGTTPGTRPETLRPTQKRTPPKRGADSSKSCISGGLIGESPALAQRAESAGVPARKELSVQSAMTPGGASLVAGLVLEIKVSGECQHS